MGAVSFFNFVDKNDMFPTPKVAYAYALEKSRHDYGDSAYSGNIGAKPDWELEQRNNNEPIYRRDAMKFCHSDIDNNDKWGATYYVPVYDDEEARDIIGWVFYGLAPD
jgi:hypothetical protein